jgi:hypothetical protein
MEIIGVPDKPDESCREVVELIETKLGVKLIVVNAFHTHSKLINRSREFIAILQSIEKKQNIMDSTRKKT